MEQPSRGVDRTKKNNEVGAPVIPDPLTDLGSFAGNSKSLCRFQDGCLVLDHQQVASDHCTNPAANLNVVFICADPEFCDQIFALATEALSLLRKNMKKLFLAPVVVGPLGGAGCAELSDPLRDAGVAPTFKTADEFIAHRKRIAEEIEAFELNR